MSLRNIQASFKTFMLQPLPYIDQAQAEFISLFEEGTVSFTERMKVYHANVVGSLSKALASHFPLLEKLVGDEFLLMLARGFVMAHPPSQGCLQKYGQGFDSFISSHPQAQNLPYLADVATFEYAMVCALHAEDDLPLSMPDLAQIPPENLADTKLTLRCSVQFMLSPYPLLDLRDFCLNPEIKTAPVMGASLKKTIMVLRPEWDIIFVELADDEYVFLQSLAKGKALGESLECALENNSAFDITFVLQRHAVLGTFAALS